MTHLENNYEQLSSLDVVVKVPVVVFFPIFQGHVYLEKLSDDHVWAPGKLDPFTTEEVGEDFGFMTALFHQFDKSGVVLDEWFTLGTYRRIATYPNQFPRDTIRGLFAGEVCQPAMIEALYSSDAISCFSLSEVLTMPKKLLRRQLFIDVLDAFTSRLENGQNQLYEYTEWGDDLPAEEVASYIAKNPVDKNWLYG